MWSEQTVCVDPIDYCRGTGGAYFHVNQRSPQNHMHSSDEKLLASEPDDVGSARRGLSARQRGARHQFRHLARFTCLIFQCFRNFVWAINVQSKSRLAVANKSVPLSSPRTHQRPHGPTKRPSRLTKDPLSHPKVPPKRTRATKVTLRAD